MTTPFSSTTDFPTWDGERSSFRYFFEAARIRAKQAETTCGTCTSFMYTAAEFGRLPYAINLLGPPGGPAVYHAIPVPMQPDVVAGTANEMAIYKTNLGLFHKQEDEFKEFSISFMAVLPPHVITDLESHFATSLVNVTFDLIVQQLRARYGVLTHEVLQSLHEQFNTPYNGDSDLNAFIHKHVQLHNELAHHGFPLNEYEKIDKFKAALTPCGHFQLAFTLFQDSNRDPLLATFLQFVETMRTNQKAFLATSTTAGYASSAAKSELQSLRDELASLRDAIQSTAAAATVAPPSEYCWTHGVCYHNGRNCRNPAENHKADATSKNRQGGSNAVTQTRPPPAKGKGGRQQGRGGGRK
jgi:hypothetical protein